GGLASLVLNGTGAGNLRFASGSETLQNLTLNRPGMSVMLITPLTVTNLTLTDGVLNTDSQTLTVAAGGTVTRGNGFVAGNLRKTVPTGAPNVTFELGRCAAYAPVHLAFSNV